MENRTKGGLALALVAALAVGTAGGFIASNETRPATDENLNAVLWMQTSQEYQMSAVQAFRLAELMVERALADPDWTAIPGQRENARNLQKTAVILDADETFLHNAGFQGQLLLDDANFNPGKWAEWQRTGTPELVPGAGHFIRRLQERNVDVFYITNRSHEFAETFLKVLKEEHDLPVTDQGANLLSKDKPPTKGSDKQSRREIVAQTHRVLLLIGDDLNDFVSGGVYGTKATLESRAKAAEAYKEFWGTKWIILPNPMYGSWERVLYGFNSRLSRKEKLDAKYGHLRGR